MPNWYTEQGISVKAPIKDLALLNNKGRKIEVRMSHKEILSQEDPRWEQTDLVAKFEKYEYARQYAELLADHKFIWVGGVLVR